MRPSELGLTLGQIDSTVLSVAEQRAEDFETPTRDEIIVISQQHVGMMETSDADDAWIWAGMQHVLLHTIGRRSGKEHKVALPFWRDPNGHRVVVASFAGDPKNPSWFVNLADKDANPEVKVRVQGGLYWMDAQVLTGDEYDATWAGLTADRPWYNDYQAKTERTIPLVRLVEARPI
jgi:deazaflavin-dependent oxidoreductase (nitroreductase family)